MEKTLGSMNNLQAQGLATKTPATKISLSVNEFYPLDRGQAGRVQGLQGELWITVPGDGKDYMVGAGETFRVPKRKGVLVQALSQASFYLFK